MEQGQCKWGSWQPDMTVKQHQTCIKTHCWSCKCEEGLCELWIIIAPLILCFHCPRAAVCLQKSSAEPLLATCPAAQGTWLQSILVRIGTLHSSIVTSSHSCCWRQGTSGLASEKGSGEWSCKIHSKFSMWPVDFYSQHSAECFRAGGSS